MCVVVGGGKVYVGLWDKDIWFWDIEIGSFGCKFSGYFDFVKILFYISFGGKEVFISGGVDKKIFVWDIVLGKRLYIF